ncbi:hypothetical protein SNE40_010357 [Patella caerulea]|uniref:Uncharacterized protein n=1 Tax=Patella caerulea TaxID=87958 RepID=A0AAN8PSR6_PATCE
MPGGQLRPEFHCSVCQQFGHSSPKCKLTASENYPSPRAYNMAPLGHSLQRPRQPTTSYTMSQRQPYYQSQQLATRASLNPTQNVNAWQNHPPQFNQPPPPESTSPIDQ